MADANRIGLKYLAGCQEEYCGGYFTGIDGYPDAAAVGRSGRSYSRAEYTRLLQEAGFGGLTFYYPYPDHKFPSVIYSDEWLPQKGELAEGRSNYDRDRVACFNERVMFDSLLEEGVFQTFSIPFDRSCAGGIARLEQRFIQNIPMSGRNGSVSGRI